MITTDLLIIFLYIRILREVEKPTRINDDMCLVEKKIGDGSSIDVMMGLGLVLDLIDEAVIMVDCCYGFEFTDITYGVDEDKAQLRERPPAINGFLQDLKEGAWNRSRKMGVR
ncbi:hypothetical protein Tco_0717509, partial [Tanacetum coccineum]